MVSPDAGGVERARAFAKRLNAPLAIIDKRREEAQRRRSDERGRRGGGPELFDGGRSDRYGRHAGERRGGVDAERRAAALSACATHAVLSGPAVERIEESVLKEVVLTNSIPLSDEAKRSSKIKSLSVAPLLARAIQSIHEETSVSSLFV